MTQLDTRPAALDRMPVGRRHLPLLCTLLSPLHHGAGTAGNTALLRTQRICLPDGSVRAVPMVSGNSLRHRLRDTLAWHLAHTLGLGDGSLTKPQVDLLWSGGALTSTGQSRLDLTRRAEQLLPHLGLLGYSAGAEIVAGTVNVNMLHLVCAENAWRLPAELGAGAKPAAAHRGEDFGTRHDVSGSAVDRLIALSGDSGTVQMIYEFQTLMPGARLAGSIDTTAATTPTQWAVLLVALDGAAPRSPDGWRVLSLGAKAASGYGQAAVDLDHVADQATFDQARVWWEWHLREHRQDILDLLAEITR